MFGKREKEEITSLKLLVRQLENKIDTLENQLIEARYRVIATSREDIIDKLEKLLDRLKNESPKSDRPTSDGRARLIEMQETIEAALKMLWKEIHHSTENDLHQAHLRALSFAREQQMQSGYLQGLGGILQFR